MSTPSASPPRPSSAPGPYVARTLDPKRVAAIKQMCRPGRPDACTRIAGAFLSDVDGQVPDLVHAIAGENLREVARLAHYLKGSASVVGAQGFAALLRDLDEEARAGRIHTRAAERLAAVAEQACQLVTETFQLD